MTWQRQSAELRGALRAARGQQAPGTAPASPHTARAAAQGTRVAHQPVARGGSFKGGADFSGRGSCRGFSGGHSGLSGGGHSGLSGGGGGGLGGGGGILPSNETSLANPLSVMCSYSHQASSPPSHLATTTHGGSSRGLSSAGYGGGAGGGNVGRGSGSLRQSSCGASCCALGGGGGGGGGGIDPSNQTSAGNPLSVMCSHAHRQQPAAPSRLPSFTQPTVPPAVHEPTMPSTSVTSTAPAPPAPLLRSAAATATTSDVAVPAPSGRVGTALSLKEKVQRIQHELDIPPSVGIASALREAGSTMKLHLQGTPAEQAEQVMASLGI